MPAAAKTYWPSRENYVPLKLKTLIARYGLSQRKVAAAVTQTNGEPLSATSLSFVVNHGEWPRTTPPDQLCRQVNEYLRSVGVAEEDIATCWELEPDAPRGHALQRRRYTGADASNDPRTVGEADDLPVERAMLTQAARKHFQLFRDPFNDDVQAEADLFLTPDIRYIRETFLSTAKHGGFLAVVGESGAGKTILRRDLLDRIAREQLPITIIQPRTIDKRQLTASYICQAIVQDLRPGDKMSNRLEVLARHVERLLKESAQAGNSHCLIIEEAHDLTISTLKYLKRFWELEHGFRKLLSIILVGQPELKSLLDERQHFEAREVIRRIEIAELLPLDNHLEDYLALKMKRVGKAADDILAPDAYAQIRARLTQTRRQGEAVSSLYPLIVNNLVTRALNTAAELGVPKITRDVIEAL